MQILVPPIVNKFGKYFFRQVKLFGIDIATLGAIRLQGYLHENPEHPHQSTKCKTEVSLREINDFTILTPSLS